MSLNPCFLHQIVKNRIKKVLRVMCMTLTIKCGSCGFKFFNDAEDVISPLDILRRYAHTCPSCFKRLEFNFNRIFVKNEDMDIIEKRMRMIRIRKITSVKRHIYNFEETKNI
jgi:hypothetical protein